MKKVGGVHILKRKIEETRRKLNEAIERRESSEKILEISRELDRYIEQYLEQIGQ